MAAPEPRLEHLAELRAEGAVEDVQMEAFR